MTKDFVKRVNTIVQPIVSNGASVKIFPSGNAVIAQLGYKNDSAVLSGSEQFVEQMIKAFVNTAANEKTSPEASRPDNIIDMTSIQKVNNLIKAKHSTANYH